MFGHLSISYCSLKSGILQPLKKVAGPEPAWVYEKPETEGDKNCIDFCGFTESKPDSLPEGGREWHKQSKYTK